MPSWKKVITSGSNAILNNITTSGNISNVSGDFTLDVAGDIILDADGTDIILKDGGTSFGSFKRVSSDFVIKSEAQDKDIVFKGNDGGSTITAMTIDMSEGGNVGIGTTSPSTMLHLKSSTSTKPKITIEDTNADDNMGALQFIKDSASPGTGDKLMQIWAYGDNNAAEQILYSEIATLPTSVTDGSEEGSMRFRVMNAGSFGETMRIRGNKVGIGTTNPSVALEVNGDISGSVIRASGDVIAFNSSDERFKDNIQPISEPLWKLNQIGGYTFNWNDKQDVYEGHDVGVIAQEVHKVLPEVVGEKSDGYLGVKYEKIVPLLIESVKELTKKTKKLERELKKLKRK